MGDVYERKFMLIEILLAVAIVGGVILWIELFGHRQAFVGLLAGNHQALYGAISTVAGSLLGFVLAAATVILAYGQMPRFRVLRGSGQFHTIFQIYSEATTFLGFTTLVGFVGLVLDTDRSPTVWITYLAMILIAISGVRFYRCAWTLQRMTEVAFRTDPSDEPA